MTPRLLLTHCFVTVHDQDAALRFYRDVLGLEVRTDATLEQFRWLTVGPADQPEIEVGLVLPGLGYSARDAESVRELMAKGALNWIIFRTDDCDKTFHQLKDAGAEIAQEPADQPYGVRDCAFRDPSGNHIRFSQPAEVPS
jgi:predicted enzyme related to lactoylglutathione lyase